MKNIIVLTSGLSGSSVVTNLLSKAGYWAGDSTCKKTDYNTYENSDLVYLNELLLKAVDYDKGYSISVKAEKIRQVEFLFNTIDLEPFKTFIEKCDVFAPWIWKDPRLWVTMPFWIQMLNKDNLHIVFIDRSISQRWVSELLRKNVQTLGYCRQYNAQIKGLIKSFILKHKIKNGAVLFDDLILKPEQTLLDLNNSLGIDLKVEDLHGVYNKPLYKKTRGKKSLLIAVLIYLKNYRSRLK